jgi:hypothetical protein
VGGFVPRVGLLVASLGVFGSAIAIAIALHKPKHARTRADRDGDCGR